MPLLNVYRLALGELSVVRAEELFKPSIHEGLEAFYGVNNCKFLR